MPASALQHINVLGVRVAAVNMESAVACFLDWLQEGVTGRYVCVSGVHGVMESFRNPEIRRAHNAADACVPDGMPMTWVGRLGGKSSMNRVYGPDLMLNMLEVSAEHGFTNYFYGGAEGVAEALKVRMTGKFPGLRVVGTHCPPFRALTRDEEDLIIAEVNRLRPDLMWIGLSTPKQELFMSRFHQRLQTKIMFGVGAAFDFHTGRVRQAPRWMMRNGLEWLFRMCVEPRRLAPRYLRNNPAFIKHIALQMLGLRQYPLD